MIQKVQQLADTMFQQFWQEDDRNMKYCIKQFVKHLLGCIIRSLYVCHAIYLDVFRLIFVYPFYFFLLHLLLVPQSLLNFLMLHLFGKRQRILLFLNTMLIQERHLQMHVHILYALMIYIHKTMYFEKKTSLM